MGPSPAGFEGTWLCPTPLDRARMLELDERLGAGGNAIQVIFPASCAFAAFWVGPWALLPLACGPLFAAAPKLMPRMRKPEWLMLAALLTFVCALGVAVALTGGARSPLIFWLTFYMVGVASRFARTGIVVASCLGAAVLVAAVVAADPSGLPDALPTLAVMLAVGFLSGRYTRLLAGTEQDHREAALLDPLTGLLNRTALESRFEELRQQAAQVDDPISIVVCDLDDFKAINDTHGHDRGDQVLQAVGHHLRENTRSFELIYRLGGEEFQLVLPGRDLKMARDVVARVRRTLADARPGGLAVTACFGISCGWGENIEFGTLFHAADQALLAAKAARPDTVVTAAGPLDPPASRAA